MWYHVETFPLSGDISISIFKKIPLSHEILPLSARGIFFPKSQIWIFRFEKKNLANFFTLNPEFGLSPPGISDKNDKKRPKSDQKKFFFAVAGRQNAGIIRTLSVF